MEGHEDRGVGSAAMVFRVLLCLSFPIEARNIIRSPERMWSRKAACVRQQKACGAEPRMLLVHGFACGKRVEATMPRSLSAVEPWG